MKNVPKDMLRRDDVVWWMQHLEMVDHYVEPETALTIANWWDDRQGPLILEGPPGGGKTSLVKRIAELMGVPFYRLQCYKSIGKGESLYDWDKNVQGVLVQEAAKNNVLGEDVNQIIYQKPAMVLGILGQCLEDGDEDVIVLIDELDKIPSEEAFEGLLLEFLEESAITIPELNSRITPKSGKRPHVVITSNAGRGGLKESLSHPVLRRGRYIYLPEPDPGRQFSILEQAAPNLSKTVIRDVVAFTHWAKKLVRFEKPIALSEVIMWARTLEMCKVKELTASVIPTRYAKR
jgi:MoxR-like ATPase